jgi:hypothetical protein
MPEVLSYKKTAFPRLPTHFKTELVKSMLEGRVVVLDCHTSLTSTYLKNINFLVSLLKIQPLFDSKETIMSSPYSAKAVPVKVEPTTQSVKMTKAPTTITFLLFMIFASSVLPAVVGC